MRLRLGLTPKSTTLGDLERLLRCTVAVQGPSGVGFEIFVFIINCSD